MLNHLQEYTQVREKINNKRLDNYANMRWVYLGTEVNSMLENLVAVHRYTGIQTVVQHEVVIAALERHLLLYRNREIHEWLIRNAYGN